MLLSAKASIASASKEVTKATFLSRPKARPWAVEAAILTPVKEPGPWLKTIPSKSFLVRELSFKRSSIIGIMISAWCWGANSD